MFYFSDLVSLILSTGLVDVDESSGGAGSDLSSTALIKAVNRGDASAARALIAAGADPNLRDGEGRLPIVQAVWRDSPEVFEVLVADPDVDVNAADGAGRTPLISCVERKQREKLAMVLERTDLDINGRVSFIAMPLY